MKSKTLDAQVWAECQKVPGKKGMLSSYPDSYWVRLVVKTNGRQLIVEEKVFDNKAEAGRLFAYYKNVLGA